MITAQEAAKIAQANIAAAQCKNWETLKARIQEAANEGKLFCYSDRPLPVYDQSYLESKGYIVTDQGQWHKVSWEQQ